MKPAEGPAPVIVANPEPLAVTDTSTEPRDVRVVGQEDTTAQTTARSVAALARVDADILRTDDQRRISGMWERTQQVIALSVVEVTLLVVAAIVASPGLATIFGYPVPESATAAASTGIVFLASVANLVIGFYFGRTNHTRVGGVTTHSEEGGGR